jgi:hypothetical protein
MEDVSSRGGSQELTKHTTYPNLTWKMLAAFAM